MGLVVATRGAAGDHVEDEVDPQLILGRPCDVLIEHREELRLVARVPRVVHSKADVVRAQRVYLCVVRLTRIDQVDVRPAAAGVGGLVVEVLTAEQHGLPLVHELGALGGEEDRGRAGDERAGGKDDSEHEEEKDEWGQLADGMRPHSGADASIYVG